MGIRLNKIFRTVTKAFQSCLRRFPVAVFFIFMLTLYLIYIVSHKIADEKAELIWGYYLSVGTLLSVSLHLWTEELHRKLWERIIQATGHLALMADALFLYYTSSETNYTEIGIAHAAGIFTIGLSVFFLSFFREKNDMPSWNFAMQSMGALATSCFLGWVMCGGICLLIASLHALFGLSIDRDCYAYASIITCVWLPLMLFIGLLPQGKEKHNASPLRNKFLESTMHYLFLPLTAAYLIVLYIYACQILVRWELPNGWVSWLVIVLMTLCLILEFGLYPSRIGLAKKWDVSIARWLPVLILPLLVLMTIGIGRRLYDYGITINRLYLLTLNSWFYAVCIGLFVCKGKRINWIPISFALLFLLTSALPVNYANYTRRTIYKNVERQVKAHCKEQLPMNGETYLDWMSQQPKEQAVQINSQLKYLDIWFREKSYSPILKDGYVLYNFQYEATDTVAVEPIDENEQGIILDVNLPSLKVNIPQGYTMFYPVSLQMEYDVAPTLLKADTIPVSIALYHEGIQDTIYFDTQTLRALNGGHTYGKLPLFRCKQDKHAFALSKIEIEKSREALTFTYSGYLFKK